MGICKSEIRGTYSGIRFIRIIQIKFVYKERYSYFCLSNRHEIKVAALFELRKQDTECLHCHSFYSETTKFNRPKEYALWMRPETGCVPSIYSVGHRLLGRT